MAISNALHQNICLIDTTRTWKCIGTRNTSPLEGRQIEIADSIGDPASAIRQSEQARQVLARGVQKPYPSGETFDSSSRASLRKTIRAYSTITYQ
jgi:hypothetical protein